MDSVTSLDSLPQCLSIVDVWLCFVFILLDKFGYEGHNKRNDKWSQQWWLYNPNKQSWSHEYHDHIYFFSWWLKWLLSSSTSLINFQNVLFLLLVPLFFIILFCAHTHTHIYTSIIFHVSPFSSCLLLCAFTCVSFVWLTDCVINQILSSFL